MSIATTIAGDLEPLLAFFALLMVPAAFNRLGKLNPNSSDQAAWNDLECSYEFPAFLLPKKPETAFMNHQAIVYECVKGKPAWVNYVAWNKQRSNFRRDAE